jgi:hypothetical protein
VSDLETVARFLGDGWRAHGPHMLFRLGWGVPDADQELGAILRRSQERDLWPVLSEITDAVSEWALELDDNGREIDGRGPTPLAAARAAVVKLMEAQK